MQFQVLQALRVPCPSGQSGPDGILYVADSVAACGTWADEQKMSVVVNCGNVKARYLNEENKRCSAVVCFFGWELHGFSGGGSWLCMLTLVV